MRKVLISLTLCTPLAYLITSKYRKVKSEYQAYFAQLNHALKKQRGGASAGIVDLDRLHSNMNLIQKKLGSSYKLRIVTKSLPSLDLLKYLMTKAQTNRLMVFSEPFLVEMLLNMNCESLDILLGKPLPVDAFARLTSYDGWNTISWLIDTKERLQQYLHYAQREHIQIKISLEIDVGLHRGGFEAIEDFNEAVRIIKANSEYLKLTGLMGYDGHIPYVPFYFNKERSTKKAFLIVQRLYDQFVNELRKHYDIKTIHTMTFNSGGSHTYFYYPDYQNNTPVNDIAIGSAFLAPQQFADIIRQGHQPALFLSSPVLKKITPSKLPHVEILTTLINLWDPNLQVSYFMLDGGWPGELVSPLGLKKNYWWDENKLGYSNLLPNQSILSSSNETNVNVDDFVFYHPWEGDGMLCFKKLVLYRQSGIVGESDTYQKGN